MVSAIYYMACELIQLKITKVHPARHTMTHVLPNQRHQSMISILGNLMNCVAINLMSKFSNDHYSIIQTPYEETIHQGSSYEEHQRSPVEVESSLSTSTTQLAKESNEVVDKESKETKLEATLSLDPEDGSMRFIDSPISVHRFT